MIRLIRFLITGEWNRHSHQWNDESRYNVKSDGKIIGVVIIQKCQDCGDVRRVDLT